MLSICIPVYQCNVSSLVNDLLTQSKGMDEKIEIILIDDASSEDYRKINRAIEGVQYVQLEHNIGRAAIRNRFLKYAKYNHLLFLDTDSIVIRDHFLKEYVQLTKEGKGVICGGRVYPDTIDDNNRSLSWKYGIQRESKPAEERSQNPHQSFMTNNFVVSRSILDEIRFDESLKGYGHEDTLFGYRLMKRRVPVYHMDNPILNGDIETNQDFLAKTEDGIKSLVKVLNIVNFDPDFIASVHLLKFYYTKKGVMPFVRIWYNTRKKAIKAKLLKGSASVRTFNLYKLAFFGEVLRNSKKN